MKKRNQELLISNHLAIGFFHEHRSDQWASGGVGILVSGQFKTTVHPRHYLKHLSDFCKYRSVFFFVGLYIGFKNKHNKAKDYV